MGGNISAHFTGFSGGILMSLIAFSIVFLVCVGLMLMMMALKHFAAYVDKATAEKETKTAAVAVAPAAPAAAAPHVSAAAAGEDMEEIVAVITAAIMASRGAGVRILSIKPTEARTAASSAWRMTGILQNAEGLGESF